MPKDGAPSGAAALTTTAARSAGVENTWFEVTDTFGVQSIASSFRFAASTAFCAVSTGSCAGTAGGLADGAGEDGGEDDAGGAGAGSSLALLACSWPLSGAAAALNSRTLSAKGATGTSPPTPKVFTSLISAAALRTEPSANCTSGASTDMAARPAPSRMTRSPLASTRTRSTSATSTPATAADGMSTLYLPASRWTTLFITRPHAARRAPRRRCAGHAPACFRASRSAPTIDRPPG